MTTRRLLFLLPAALFLVLSGAFAAWLLTGRDARHVPSALIDRPVPAFSLAAIEGMDGVAGNRGFADADLRGAAGPVLVNFWASWCIPCLVEHPQLMRLAREGVPIFGVNYKDKPEDARAFLARHGDPFRRHGADRSGRVAVDFGVYGVPETYLIDRDGRIRWRYAGPITEAVLEGELRPRLAALRR
ncbi:MAG: DsbE family thiol:disulfide interchange protein [Alphaproteobacteria bacterium]|nr:DsbE family thiol:disulfide interchange protein [Alphaproteobacteria bacterium]